MAGCTRCKGASSEPVCHGSALNVQRLMGWQQRHLLPAACARFTFAHAVHPPCPQPTDTRVFTLCPCACAPAVHYQLGPGLSSSQLLLLPQPRLISSPARAACRGTGLLAPLAQHQPHRPLPRSFPLPPFAPHPFPAPSCLLLTRPAFLCMLLFLALVAGGVPHCRRC